MKENWLLENCIHEVLRKDELVVIPHFGAFVSDYESAKISQIAILPPSRKVLFNKNLTKDDGTLTRYVSEILEQEYIKSKLTIAEAVYGWKKQLAYGETVDFKQIGSLSLNENGHLMFQSIEQKELQGAYFGLDRVNAQKLVKEEKPVLKVQEEQSEEIKVKETQTQPKVVELEAPVKSEPKKKVIPLVEPEKKLWSVGKVAAIATPILLAGLGIYGTIKLQSDSQYQFANMFDFFKSDKQVEMVDEAPALEITQTVNAEDFFTMDEINAIAKEENETVAETASVSKKEKQFHVIAGCFSQESNAIEFVEDLKTLGFDAELVGTTPSGLHRVAYGSHETKKEALLQLAKIKLNNNPSSWILSR